MCQMINVFRVDPLLVGISNTSSIEGDSTLNTLIKTIVPTSHALVQVEVRVLPLGLRWIMVDARCSLKYNNFFCCRNATFEASLDGCSEEHASILIRFPLFLLTQPGPRSAKKVQFSIFDEDYYYF